MQSPPASNYSAAIARAVEWLGDRYLLAKPINMHARHHREAAAAEPAIHAKGFHT
jgi:hypothetical protein